MHEARVGDEPTDASSNQRRAGGASERNDAGAPRAPLQEDVGKKRRGPRLHTILFLDVDGVLNTEFCRPRDALHGKLLRRLGEVVAATGAKLVLSTTWRLHPSYRTRLLEALNAVGIRDDDVVGDTPQLPLKLGPWPPAENQRAAEIVEWLSEFRARAGRAAAVARWAAVDDLDLTQSAHSDAFHGHFVRTSKESGLSEACTAELCDILGAGTDAPPPPSQNGPTAPPRDGQLSAA